MMSETKSICVIIGANQAGVSCAFALRKEGWKGKIILYDVNPSFPVYRPPLSKSILLGIEKPEDHFLKPQALFEKEGITLNLGKKVVSIHRNEKVIKLENGENQSYDKLVLATGGRPIIPKIPGIDAASNVFTLRTPQDTLKVREQINKGAHKKVVIIGAGYIGLETAASLNKLGAEVTVLEREERVLSRVTAPEMSGFYQALHKENGVEIHTSKEVNLLSSANGRNTIVCTDGSNYFADIIIVGVGIQVNTELAENASLETKNGIVADASMKTNDKNIYAIGDCSYHFNTFYSRYLRLESVQNANDQAKVAAADICGKDVLYQSVPWFWSDQYNIKLQIVGLSEGYNNTVLRKEVGNKFSIWYFKDEKLLAVDAVNDMKAYMIGTKFLKTGQRINKSKLLDLSEDFKPGNLSI